MKTEDLLRRLSRSITRLNEFYESNAPQIIIKAELSIIEEICKELESKLNSKIKE